MDRPICLLLTLTALLGTGCATTLSTLDTARTTPVGKVRCDVGRGIHLPIGSIVKGAVAAGAGVAQSIKSQKATISPEDAEKLYEAGLATALNLPSDNLEFMIRTGLMEDLDVGLRYSITALRLDLKLRFFHVGVDDVTKNHNLSIGLGVSKYLFNNPVFEALEYLKIDGFSRWDVEVPLLYSWEYKSYFAFYGGFKYIYTSFELDQNLYGIQKHVSNMANIAPITDSVRSDMHLFGGTIGLAGGAKNIWVYTELTAGYTYLRPTLYSFVDGKSRRRNLDGFSLYPAIGVVWRI